MHLLRKILLSLFLVAIIAFSGANGNAATDDKRIAKARTVLVVGDSLSAAYGIDARSGWVSLLQKRLASLDTRYTVINASITGDTTAGGRNRMPNLLKTYKPSIVIIELGANDGLRGLPLDQMKQNIAKMIRMAQQSGVKVVLAGVRIPPNYGPQYTQGFRQNFESLAKQHKTVFIPFLLKDVAENPRLMQDDNYHPNEQAQVVILENVWVQLEQLL
ncbi:MAG: arylesterase [Gammaproteobacteria bacterium]|nr:arylesterase [Gammaproteobacteria bacterium]